MKRNVLRSVLIILCALLCVACVSCKSNDAPKESSAPAAESSTPVEESSTPAAEEFTPPESEDAGETVGPHEHEFTPEWQKNDIYHWHSCTLCEVDNDVAKHDMEIIVTNKEPTADAPGEGIFACRVCGAVKEGEIPPLGNA